MHLEQAEQIANQIVKRLSPYCERIEIAGSIRRQNPSPKDIDLVLIPEDRYAIDRILMELGQIKMGGLKIARVMMDSISLDVYYATPETWATLLLIRTGSSQNNIRLATLAKKRGWHLHASGHGLFNGNGQRIAGDTEESIYEALGIPYQRPEERD